MSRGALYPWVIVLIASMGVVVLVALAWRRGTDPRPPSPPTSDSAPADCGVVLDTAGLRSVRCVVLIPAPPERVFEIATDYRHFNHVFQSPWVDVSIDSAERKGSGAYHLVGHVDTPLGDYPIEVDVEHRETPALRTALWNSAGGALVRNTGSWEVSAQGGDTLLVYTLGVEVRGVPSFIINDALLMELPHLLERVRERASAHAPATPGAP